MQDEIKVMTEAQYYLDREDRRRSLETDFGVHWTDSYRDWPSYRCSFVHATGELYAVQQGGNWPVPGDRRLEILGRFRDLEHAEEALEGWAEHCGRGGMDWIRLHCQLRGLR